MPYYMSDLGVSCRNCGKFINLFSPALSTMPDPFTATCPYCDTTTSYQKSAVRNVVAMAGLATNKALAVTVLIAAFVLLAGILYIQHQANGVVRPF